MGVKIFNIFNTLISKPKSCILKNKFIIIILLFSIKNENVCSFLTKVWSDVTYTGQHMK